jgi:hypothetical protein
MSDAQRLDNLLAEYARRQQDGTPITPEELAELKQRLLTLAAAATSPLLSNNLGRNAEATTHLAASAPGH